MKLRNSILTLAMLLATAGWAHADSISGTLYYTTYTLVSGSNVWKVDFDYDGVSTFSLTNNTGVGALGGADGIVFDPVSGDLLIGGQSNTTYKFDPQGVNPTVAVASGDGVLSFHLSVDPSGDTVWAGYCCGGGNLGEIPLSPFADGTGHVIGGDDTFVDTLAWVPDGQGGYTVWYTSSNEDGGEGIGIIDLSTFTTTRVFSNLPASHGMVFDPFTNTLVTMGDSHLTQIDPFTQTIVADVTSPVPVNFDQGTVDGKGHLFAATNGGTLVFIDYSASGLIDDGFVGAQFLNFNLDDIAPLVGPGAPPVPEPMTLSLLGLGVAAAGRREWKRRSARA